MATRSSGTKRKNTRTSSKKGKSSQKNNGVGDEVLLVLSLAVSVLLLLSTFGLLGKIGKAIGSVLFGLFGMVAYVFPFFFAFALFFIVVNKGKKITKIKLSSAVLFLIMLCCIAHLLFGKNVDAGATSKLTYYYTVHATSHASGGFFGGVIIHFLKKFLGTFGAVIIILALTIISGVLFTERSFFKTVKKSGENLVEDARRMKEYRSRQAEVYEIEREERHQRAQLRSEERDIARKKRLAEQDARREENLRLRRERAEQARIAREENAQKARDEARALYLKQQADEQLRKKEEESRLAQEKLKAELDAYKASSEAYESDVISEGFNDSDDFDAEFTEDATIADNSVLEDNVPTVDIPSPSIMSFGPKDESAKRRIDNKVSGVMPHTMLFDLSETNGEIREITPSFEGSTISFDDKVLHTEHRITVSDAEDSNAVYKESEVSASSNAPFSLDRKSYELPFVEKTISRSDLEEDIPPVHTEDYETIDSLNEDSYDDILVSSYEDEDKDKHIFTEDLSVAEGTEEIDDVPVIKAAEPVKPEPNIAQEDNSNKLLSRPQAVKSSVKGLSNPDGNRVIKDYKLPPISLLNEVKNSSGNDASDELRETGNKLKEILKTFGVNITISGASRGPSVTRYEIQPEIGTKVSKVVSLTDDIKMALAATDIRMEAPIPGKSAIGIEVPNRENTAVQYRELVESRTFRDSKSKISFAVGKDLNGQVIVTDINKLPHVLIAGATGSGKSVCINTLIMSILYKATPEEVRLIMIDPKVVELSVYNEIPHLLLPVVTDPKKASASLQWAVNEMMRRYKCFEELKVRNIEGYNTELENNPEYAESGTHKRMPQIVIIVDELADLMMVASKEVEESICRLAQLARAAGIHLVLATQRPSVNVVTGLIKANMPSRIAFAVSSGIDSRTILDMVGAEKLLGKGDMLFYPQGYTKPSRVQGAFVSDDEVRRVADFLKAQNNGISPYDESAKSHVDNGGNTSANTASGGFSAPEQDNGLDPLFYEAGRSIIEKQKASIGMLQRLHKIGFNRAARIMDQLADASVVGPEEGTKARAILMTLEDFENYVQEINQ